MKVGLFIPCYIDKFYPHVGIATLEFLEKCGVEVEYPAGQTCCGQPMANSGFESESISVYEHFVETFSMYDYIVTPSASCAYHVHKHYNIISQSEPVKAVRSNIFEFVHFIIEVLRIKNIEGSFPYTVGLHLSCHGQRGLGNATVSERTPHHEGELHSLLTSINNIKLTPLDRNDECCGFGGTFCVAEEAVSARMGKDRVKDHVRNGTQIITSGDMSCLMHLDGIIRREKFPIKVMHIAEILNAVKK
jgi:L-lactate dehydrogenase complex protein LldE